MKNLKRKNPVRFIVFVVLFFIVNMSTLLAQIMIAGFYSGFGSNGQMTSARVRNADDGIFVTSFGQTLFMTKIAPNIYVDPAGFKCVFNQGDMMFQNVEGTIFYLKKTGN